MFTAGPTFTRVPSRARAGGVTTSLNQTITITITLAGATGAAVAQHVIQHMHSHPECAWRLWEAGKPMPDAGLRDLFIPWPFFSSPDGWNQTAKAQLRDAITREPAVL